ncbi:MAG: glycoside hydrolase family 57 protein [Burkholderiales bacterium]|nr:glycoside hydrolase family 57 protein [Burkholderiales bacterium]
MALVLVWHMHQPDYRDRASGEFAMPWVLLHALKDYTDMAWHLERHAVRATVNFAPVLLDQIEDYAAQLASGRLRDPLLRLLAREPDRSLAESERRYALAQCFRANAETMIRAFPAYRRLEDVHRAAGGEAAEGLAWLTDRYFDDLVTWYFLAWTGETVRRESATVARLMAKGAGFTYEDRRALLDEIARLVGSLIARWRALAESGRVELSTTPHTHPIGPLLVDFAAAREAAPAAPLPEHERYPGGIERTLAQLESALATHRARFGVDAAGVWPAEGAVSSAFLRLLASRGVRWTASGEGVLARSLAESGGYERLRDLYRPWRLDGVETALFFRDDRLSDLVGFEYRRWHGRDAAAHLVGEVERIGREARAAEPPVVAVILDGENPWEHYPYNGFYFLSALYETLEKHPTIRTRTPSEVLAHTEPPARLSALKAGSWVQGTLLTWIGAPAKNRAWDLLCAAKHSYDLVVASGRLEPAAREAARAQLAECEGSDWFWWFEDGSANPAVAAFDRLFREKLAHLYRLLALPVPAPLAQPICAPGDRADGASAMRRADG